MLSVFHGIEARARVTYRTPQGATATGRACALLLFPAHVVVDAGRGRPQ